MAETLLGMLNASSPANKLKESALIVVDAQREYLDGKLPLSGIEPALKQIKSLLQRARTCGSDIYFIRHIVAPGAPIFNPDSPYFQIIDEVAPLPGENIVDKHHPSSFAGTNLDALLKKAGHDKLVITGFMTHACISTTTRAAAELGYRNTVVSGACATRDLPDTAGNTVTAAHVHNATMAALQDLFATVVKDDTVII